MANNGVAVRVNTRGISVTGGDNVIVNGRQGPTVIQVMRRDQTHEQHRANNGGECCSGNLITLKSCFEGVNINCCNKDATECVRVLMALCFLPCTATATALP